MNPQLHDYVKQAQEYGLSKEAIMKELLDKGWQLHQLTDLILDRPSMVSSDHIISVRGISKSYGAVKALGSVDLNVKKGIVTALLGPNGAGKTTLVRILSTLLTPDSGQAIVAGYDVVRDAESLRSVIGLAGQYAAVDEVLTGRENLVMVGRLYHLGKRQAEMRADELLKQFDLVEAGNRILKTYSGGMRRRLDLAASIIIKPQVLFLDEPTTGLDPRSRFGLWNVIRDLVEGGTTVLLTTQYLEEADQLAQEIFVIDHGGIIASGTPDELKRQVGGDILELHLTHHAEVDAALETIGELGDRANATAEKESGILTMPVSGGASVLVEAIRLLDAKELKITDIILRRPSLDDVFMKLTGHATS